MGGKKLSREDKGDGFLLSVVRPGISSFNEFSQCYLENLLENSQNLHIKPSENLFRQQFIWGV